MYSLIGIIIIIIVVVVVVVVFPTQNTTILLLLLLLQQLHVLRIWKGHVSYISPYLLGFFIIVLIAKINGLIEEKKHGCCVYVCHHYVNM